MLLDPGSGCASPLSIDGVTFGVGTWSTSRVSTVQVGQTVLDRYRAGLLMWHCFCNEKGVREEERAPATQDLVSVFVAHLAAAYSGKTISGYLNGVRAWHILHGLR